MLKILLITLFLATGCAHWGESGRYVKKGNEWVFVKTNVGFSSRLGSPHIDDAPYDFKDTGRFLWPVPSSKRISSFFGHRHGRHHDGIDIPANNGSNVVASDSGTVIFSGWMRGYGRIIVLKHDKTYHTVYGHNSKLLVSKGAHVNRGQVIALVGSSGRSTGPHVHFEIRRNNKVSDPAHYFEWVRQKKLAKK